MRQLIGKTTIAAILMITGRAMANSNDSLPSDEPGVNPPISAYELCVIQTTNDVMQDMAKAIGTWKANGSYENYKTNASILMSIQNTQSVTNRLIRHYCSKSIKNK